MKYSSIFRVSFGFLLSVGILHGNTNKDLQSSGVQKVILTRDPKSATKVATTVKPNETKIPHHADVAIVGAGILGCSTAFFLSQHASMKDKKIIVLDRDTVASGASALAAGILDTHGLIKNPSFYEYLSSYSRLILYELRDKYHQSFELNECGAIIIDVEKDYVADLHSRGCVAVDFIDKEKLIEIAPFLSSSAANRSYVFSKLCAGINPAMLTHSFAEVSTKKGVDFFEHVKVEQVVKNPDSTYTLQTNRGHISASTIVLATGSHETQLYPKSFSIQAPVIPVKGTIFAVDDEELEENMHVCLYTYASSKYWSATNWDKMLKKSFPPLVNHDTKGKRMYHHIYARRTNDGLILFGGDRVPADPENMDYKVDEKQLLELRTEVSRILGNDAPIETLGAYCC